LTDADFGIILIYLSTLESWIH